ncbi:hypothetical protein KR059_001270, partial [Drosophila kikkawai]
LWLPFILTNAGLAAGSLQVQSPVRTNNIGRFRRTTGGHVSPWVLRIMKGNDFVCGAAYISALYAVTSANCLHRYRLDLSALRVQLLKEEPEEPPFVGVSAIYVPKMWQSTHMDVAVVQLSARLSGSRVDFVRLCSKPMSLNDTVEVVACGKEVQVATISIMDTKECASQYENLLSITVACGQEFTRTETCMFEAGCPVSAGEELCGIVAGSPSTCQKKLPGILTDLYRAREFVQKVISS